MENPKTQSEDKHSPISSNKQPIENVNMSPKNPIQINNVKTESWAMPNPVSHAINNDNAHNTLLNQSLTSQPKNFVVTKSNNLALNATQQNSGVIRYVNNYSADSVKDNMEKMEEIKSQEKVASKILNSYEEEGIKRREALARRPSYRKILNDLSSASAEFIGTMPNVEGIERSTPSPTTNSSYQNDVKATLISPPRPHSNVQSDALVSNEPEPSNLMSSPLSTRLERQQQEQIGAAALVSPQQIHMNPIPPDLKLMPSNLTPLAQTYCLANLAAQTPLLNTTPGGPVMLGGLFPTPTQVTAPPLIDFSSLIMNNFAAQQQQQQQAVAAAAAQLQHQLLYQQIRAQQQHQQQQQALHQQQQQQQLLAAAYQKMATMAALGPPAPPLAHQPRSSGVKDGGGGGGKNAPPRKSSLLVTDTLDAPPSLPTPIATSGDGGVGVSSQNSSSDAKRRHVSFENLSPDKGAPTTHNLNSDTLGSSATPGNSPISNKAIKSKATAMPGLVSKSTPMGRSSATLLNLDHQPSPISPTDSNDSSQEYKYNAPPATNLPSSAAQRLIAVPANPVNNTNPNPAAANDAALQFGSQLMSLVPGAGLNLTTGPGGQYISIPLNESYYHMRTTGQGLDESANQQYLVQTGNGPPVVEEAQRKREVRLLKNREAAKECRRKKKEYVKCLENRVAVLENQNKALIEELKSLKELYCQKQE